MEPSLMLAAGGESALLVHLVVILATAGAVAVAVSRLRLPTVPAYLIAGVIIGPGALGLVGDAAEIEAIGGLAIVLLMFGIGLHFDLSALRGSLRQMLGGALGSIVVTIAVLWPLLLLFGVAAPGALVVAMALSLSSTAVVMRLFVQKRWMQRVTGRLSLAILVVQDIAVIAMLLVLPPIARWAGVMGGTIDEAAGESMGVFVELLLEGLIAMGGVVGLLLVGRFVLPHVLRIAAAWGGSEVLMVLSVAFALGSAALTAVVGLSAELGAFLGGFLLSSTPLRHYLSGQIGTIRDLFIAIFFTVLGMVLEIETLGQYWGSIILGVIVLLAVKASVIGGMCWAIGSTVGAGAKVGLSLAQAGEFGLVILLVAGRLSSEEAALLEPVLVEKVIAVIIVTLIVTPRRIELGDRLDSSGRLTRTAPWVHGGAMVDADQRQLVEGEEDRPHVIVAGFGIVGRAVCDRLSLSDATVTIVEMNVETVRRQRRLGRSIVFGDVSDPEVLESAGIHHADALVLTMPDETAVLRACRVAKQMHPDVFIIARTNFLSRAMVAHNLGANETVVEEMATAEKMDRLLERMLEGLAPGREAARAEPRTEPEGSD